MLKSMTGYGSTRFELSGRSYLFELKSYNNRGLEIHVRLPEVLAELEPRFRSALSGACCRGKVYLSVRESHSESRSLQLNPQFAPACKQAVKKLEANLKCKLDPSFVLSRPEMFSQGLPEIDEKSEKALFKNLNKVIREFDSFRKREGKCHEREINSSLKAIDKAFRHIKKNAPLVKKEKKKKMEEQYVEWFAETQSSERIWQEIVIMLDRLDFSEEMIRFGEHLSFFKKAMSEEPCGKKLNFISQELLREINTLGVKCNDFGISQNVVMVKTELEKIKEQILNIE